MASEMERFWAATGPTRTIRRFLDSFVGPLALALVLAVASTPIVAMGILGSTEDDSGSYYVGHPLTDGLILSMALLAVIVGALAGGILGGVVVRRHPVAGLFAAGIVAWPAAVATLPLVAGLTYQRFGAIFMCIDSCSPLLSGASLDSGLTTYGGSVLFGSILFETRLYGLGSPLNGFALIGLSIVLTVAAAILGHRRHRLIATLLALGAIVSFNFLSMTAAPPAALALCVGLLLWSAAFWSPVPPAGPPADGVPHIPFVG